MRTYKTWEVVKILMDNPRLRFEAKINKKKSNMWIDTEGDLVMDVVETAPDYSITDNEWLNAEWHLVETPITWQEALQAWAEGKTVICKLNDINEEYSELCFSNNHDTPLTRYQILYGQWFIVPEGVDE